MVRRVRFEVLGTLAEDSSLLERDAMCLGGWFLLLFSSRRCSHCGRSKHCGLSPNITELRLPVILCFLLAVYNRQFSDTEFMQNYINVFLHKVLNFS